MSSHPMFPDLYILRVLQGRKTLETFFCLNCFFFSKALRVNVNRLDWFHFCFLSYGMCPVTDMAFLVLWVNFAANNFEFQ